QRHEAAQIVELRRRLQALTQREREIMALVIVGRLNKQIAADLAISEATVKVHRGQIMRKMGARSLPEVWGRTPGLNQSRSPPYPCRSHGYSRAIASAAQGA
ncbi:MAG: hypothetical protein E6H63_19970, partial [Betaproteobacteria bacterium]